MPVLIEYVQKHYPWLTISSVSNSIICTLLIAVIFKWLWEKRNMYILSMKLQGPVSLPFLGSIPTIGYTWPKPEKMKWILAEHLKYPSPFRVWYFSKLVVVLTDVEDVQSLLDNNIVSTKPNMYYFWSRGIGNGLWTGQGGTNWWTHRSILNPAFSIESIKIYQNVVEKRCSMLKDVVTRHCSEKPFDIKRILEKHCVYIMGEILLGDSIQEELCDNLIQSMDKIRKLVNERLNKFWLHPDVIFKRSKSHEELLNHRGTLKSYITDVFNAKKIEFFQKRDSESTRTALQLLIEAQRNTHNLSDEEIIEEIMSLFYKGVDSFSTTLTFFIIMISIHENCRHALSKEIDDFINENDDIFDLQKVEKLQYLHDCYKETIRLFPYGALLTKHANKDLTLKEKNIVIPNGSIIAIPTYLANLNPKYWPEPTSFKPERYAVEEKIEYGIYYFSLFGVGQRMCIGEKMASYFVKSTIIDLIRSFDIYSHEKMENLNICFENSIRLSEECNLSVAKKI